jgi:hypothetical protein
MISPQPTEVSAVDIPSRSARTSVILAALESSREQTSSKRRVNQLFGRIQRLLQILHVDSQPSIEVIFTVGGPLVYRPPRQHW